MRGVFAAALPALSLAAYGVDFAGSISASTAQCLISQNQISFGSVRAWHSYGGFDSSVVGAVSTLRSAGMTSVDVYMFPCAGQGAATQVNSMVSQLKSNNVNFGRIWFDIETNPSSGCAWPSSTATNCAYMQSLVSAAAASGVSAGVYASSSMWSQIMGASCTSGGSLPLWYAHYDGNPSFSDFSPFGGWTTPTIKQYAGDATLCGLGVDKNWSPGSTPNPPSPPSPPSPPTPPSPPSPTTNNPPSPPTTNPPSPPTTNPPTTNPPTTNPPTTNPPTTNPPTTNPPTTNPPTTNPPTTNPPTTNPPTTNPPTTNPPTTNPPTTNPPTTNPPTTNPTTVNPPTTTGAGPTPSPSGPTTAAGAQGVRGNFRAGVDMNGRRHRKL